MDPSGLRRGARPRRFQAVPCGEAGPLAAGESRQSASPRDPDAARVDPPWSCGTFRQAAVPGGKICSNRVLCGDAAEQAVAGRDPYAPCPIHHHVTNVVALQAVRRAERASRRCADSTDAIRPECAPIHSVPSGAAASVRIISTPGTGCCRQTSFPPCCLGVIQSELRAHPQAPGRVARNGPDRFAAQSFALAPALPLVVAQPSRQPEPSSPIQMDPSRSCMHGRDVVGGQSLFARRSFPAARRRLRGQAAIGRHQQPVPRIETPASDSCWSIPVGP